MEITVYSAIALLALTAVYSVLLTGLRFFNTTNYAAELQQNAMRILAKLTQEVAESDAQTVQISTNPQGVSFASPRDILGNITYNNGTLQWQSFICYYVDTTNPAHLYRKQLSIAATAPVNPNVTNLKSTYTVSNFASSGAATARLLDTNVTLFTTARTGNSVTFQLKLDKRDPGGSIIYASTSTGNPLDELYITTSGVLIRN